jgi:hypothetical protein
MTYHEDYSDWAEHLPRGRSPDEAVAGLLGLMKNSDPADFDRVHALIGDPKIREEFKQR